MGSEWKCNDLALCIKNGRWRDRANGEAVDFGPRAGQVLTVQRVGFTPLPEEGLLTLLGFALWPRDSFVAARFVKVTPDERQEELYAEQRATQLACSVDDPL